MPNDKKHDRPDLLVETEWLAEHLDDRNLRIVDMGPIDAYKRAHIPGSMGLNRNYFKDPDTRLRFVAALVNGLGDEEPWPSDLGPDLEPKRFLFDIVNNKRNGVDVDKLDYLARDALAAGLTSSGEAAALRLIHASKVLPSAESGALQLGYEKKAGRRTKTVHPGPPGPGGHHHSCAPPGARRCSTTSKRSSCFARSSTRCCTSTASCTRWRP